MHLHVGIRVVANDDTLCVSRYLEPTMKLQKRHIPPSYADGYPYQPLYQK